MTKLNNIHSNETDNQWSRTSNFIENTKRAVRKALTTTWIVASSMWPMATTTSTTVVPASINTITAIAPLASTAAKTISLWTAASLLVACNKDDPEEIKDTTPPTINLNQSEVDITWGKEIKISGNQLYIWDILVASRSDNIDKNCKVELSLNWKSISSWTTISEWWTLNIKVSDMSKNYKNADIKLTIDQDISWLENIKRASLQVDKEINLLNWVSFGNGAELLKVEMELNWEKVEISDPQHFTPDYPWTCNIILTVKNKDGEIVEYKVDNLTIKPIEYKSIELKNSKPEEILPIIWKVEWWDWYKPIEHLRLAEATKIRDMMRKYGAGSHSPEEYQQLMSRLHTGMMNEYPLNYDNYQKIWDFEWRDPSTHAYHERNILNTLINHANFQIIYSDNNALWELVKNSPDHIFIIWNSDFSTYSTEIYDQINKEWYIDDGKEARDLPNFIMRIAWSNIEKNDWELKNKICHRDIPPTQEWIIYGLPSRANSTKNQHPNRHLMVTIWTNAKWNVDQTNETSPVSKFPLWFDDKVLFSWHTFPYRDYQTWATASNGYKYATSYTNYVNVAMTDICFQMFAEVENVDELLEMIRSTSLTDYIKLDWQTQKLQLINPAWFFQKYLMPTDIPNSIKSWENIPLEKWYYKWVIFDIPWTEVKINWQWIAYNDANKSQIKNQNPITLEWRLNWDLCKKMWHEGKDIKWKILTVDDKRNGLNINKDVSILVQ